MESKANMNIIHFVDGQYVRIIKRSFFAIKNLVELCPGNEDFLREFLSDRTIILWLNCYNRLILVLIVTIILQ